MFVTFNYVCVCISGAQRPEVLVPLGAEVIDRCELPGYRCWDSNSGLLEKQYVLLGAWRGYGMRFSLRAGEGLKPVML